jgi:glycosyltransferase involved in cell wall biosynthesis
MIKKHILYISYDGMTDPLGQSQVLPYLIENSISGYQFSLISFEKKDRFEKNKEIIQKICDENSINWHPLNYTKNPPIVSTLWDIFKMYLETKKINKKQKVDLIHCRSYQAAEIGMMMKNNFNIPWVFDMRGFWADERIDGNIWKMSSFIFRNIYKHYKKKEIQFLTNADQIISLTNNAKEEIISWQEKKIIDSKFKNKKLEIEVIPCCVDTDLFSNENINSSILSKIRKENSIKEDQFVLGYVGSIGTWYMLPEMLDFFRELKAQKSDALFLFITNEPAEKIITLAKSKNIAPKDLRITSCLHKDVPTYISLFTISIYFILPAYSKKASSPTKQGELMAMGIPIVCNANVGDADKIIADTNSGWVIHEFNEESYKNTVLQILNNPLPDKQNIIKEGNKEFNLHTGALKFRKTYERILGTYRH